MEEKLTKGRVSVKEFLVDFFGALMPGTLFIFFVLLVLIIPTILSFSLLENILTGGERDDVMRMVGGFLYYLQKLPAVVLITILLLLLAISYVIGTLFYRRDIKMPDRASFIKSAAHFKKGELENWVIRLEREDGTYITDPSMINEQNVPETSVQFPYNNLKGYLIARGREDLAQKINWDWEKDSKRSKTFINLLKIRLQFYCPEKCTSIIKNEAHVRLSSTMWYVAKALKRLVWFGGIPLVVVSIIYEVMFGSFPVASILGLLLISISYIFSNSAKANAEDFLHYQRVREIFYVLETARAASLHYKIDLFKVDDNF